MKTNLVTSLNLFCSDIIVFVECDKTGAVIESTRLLIDYLVFLFQLSFIEWNILIWFFSLDFVYYIGLFTFFLQLFLHHIFQVVGNALDSQNRSEYSDEPLLPSASLPSSSSANFTVTLGKKSVCLWYFLWILLSCFTIKRLTADI